MSAATKSFSVEAIASVLSGSPIVDKDAYMAVVNFISGQTLAAFAGAQIGVSLLVKQVTEVIVRQHPELESLCRVPHAIADAKAYIAGREDLKDSYELHSMKSVPR